MSRNAKGRGRTPACDTVEQGHCWLAYIGHRGSGDSWELGTESKLLANSWYFTLPDAQAAWVFTEWPIVDWSCVGRPRLIDRSWMSVPLNGAHFLEGSGC